MARQNERGLELSFKKSGDGTRGRWYTRQGGKPVYFGWGNGVSDRESYQQALTAYRTWQEKQKEVATVDHRGNPPEGFATWAQFDAALVKMGQASLEAAANAPKAGGAKEMSKLVDAWLADQKKRNERRHWVEAQRAAGKDISEGKRENLSDGRYQSYVENGEKMKEAVGAMLWDGKEATCAEILKTFRDKCEAQLQAGELSPNTFNGRMQSARAFMTWADENYKLERMPRAIQKLTAKYAYEPTAVSIPLPEVKAIWEAADDTLKAYMALALNCGYYAKDIAVLENGDIESGRIVRRRNKTGVPTNYKLWEVTEKLITAKGSRDGVIFKGQNGNPLVYHSGKFRVDAIADRWDRLLRELVAAKKVAQKYTFSNLRDTSTTMVEDLDPSFSDQFDAHTDKRIAAFYVDPSALKSRQAKFDAIVKKLEKAYGLKWSPEAASND